MKGCLTLVLLAGLVACQAEPAASAQSSSAFPTAQQWNRNVVGWNLGNQLECSAPGQDGESMQIGMPEGSINAETAWGNPVVTKKTIQAVKKAGFNAVRIPVRWQCHITNPSAMTIDKEWVARVKEVVNWCLEEDMKVIINTHHDKWLEGRPLYEFSEENNQKLALLWLNIASEFAGYDSRLAFAGTNEVHIRDLWGAPTEENLAVQNEYNQTFVDIVRSTGGNNEKRHLLVQTYVCNPDFGLNGQLIVPQDIPGNGKRYMSVEFHFYNPWEYAGSGEMDFWGEPYRQYGPAPENGEAYLKDLFDRAAMEWEGRGLGVCVGEWGLSDHCHSGHDLDLVHQNMTYYCKTYVSQARKHGFSSFIWDNNSFGNGADKFGIFDRRKGMKISAPWIIEGIQQGIND